LNDFGVRQKTSALSKISPCVDSRGVIWVLENLQGFFCLYEER